MTPSTQNKDYWNGEVTWVSAKDIKFPRITKSKKNITDKALSLSNISLLEPGKLIMVVRSGILKHTLPLAINDISLTINQDLKSIESRDEMDTEFLYWHLYGQQKTILTICAKVGATVDSIDMERLHKWKIVLPPITEQQSIVEGIEKNNSSLLRAISKTKKEIKYLKEYKTTLISEAVTGKIDVREEVLN